MQGGFITGSKQKTNWKYTYISIVCSYNFFDKSIIEYKRRENKQK